MYLSRLILNPRSRSVQRDLASPYQMHRTVMRAFPGREALTGERILFRVEDHPSLGLPTLLVQSLIRPDWSWMREEASQGYLWQSGDENPAVKPFALPLGAGQIFAFRLLANPTAKKTVEREGQREKMRVGLLREEDQRAWLARKLDNAGAELVSCRVAARGYLKSRKGEEGQFGVQTHLGVLFEGVLRVQDPDRVREAVTSGMGPAKGYGFGLLSLGPLPR